MNKKRKTSSMSPLAAAFVPGAPLHISSPRNCKKKTASAPKLRLSARKLSTLSISPQQPKYLPSIKHRAGVLELIEHLSTVIVKQSPRSTSLSPLTFPRAIINDDASLRFVFSSDHFHNTIMQEIFNILHIATLSSYYKLQKETKPVVVVDQFELSWHLQISLFVNYCNGTTIIQPDLLIDLKKMTAFVFTVVCSFNMNYEASLFMFKNITMHLSTLNI